MCSYRIFGTLFICFWYKQQEKQERKKLSLFHVHCTPRDTRGRGWKSDRMRETVTIWIVVLSLGHKAMYTVTSHILGASIFLYNWSWSRIPLRKWRIFSLILLSSFFWVYDTFAIPKPHIHVFLCSVFCVCVCALCMTVNKSDRRCISISASKHVSYLGPTEMYWKTKNKKRKNNNNKYWSIVLKAFLRAMQVNAKRVNDKRRNKAMKLIKIVFSLSSLLLFRKKKKRNKIFCSLLSLVQ